MDPVTELIQDVNWRSLSKPKNRINGKHIHLHEAVTHKKNENDERNRIFEVFRPRRDFGADEEASDEPTWWEIFEFQI